MLFQKEFIDYGDKKWSSGENPETYKTVGFALLISRAHL
jgi:hypothetical protein